ncbi:MAG: hypothetical protein R3C08_11875 [Hyphomonas sp.]
MRHLLACLAALLGAATFALPASAGKTRLDNTKEGEVCFVDAGCVKVGASYGLLGEGPRAGDGEWITEVRNAKGKPVAKVGKGGDIIVLSPEAYAKRDAGKATYSIGRIDGKGKLVSTKFVFVATQQMRTTWATWEGPVTAAIGMTSLPDTRNIDQGGASFKITETVVRGRRWVGPSITGIAPDGTLTQSYDGVAAVQYYGDYNVITFQGGTEHQVTDETLRSISPRTSAIHAFTPAFPDQPGSYATHRDPTIDYPRVMFAVERGQLGNGETLYQLLPRRKGGYDPREMIGVQPLRSWRHNEDFYPIGIAEDHVHRMTAGWAGIWAGENGPEMTFLNFDGTPGIPGRYKSLNWAGGGFRIAAGVAENFDGTAIQFVPALSWILPVFEVSPHVFPSRDAAEGDIRIRVATAESEYWEKIRAEAAADAAARAEREALQAAWKAAEEKRYAELAALEASERTEAKDILALDPANWQEICARAGALQTLYASNDAVSYCGRVRPRPEYQPVKQDFWGALASALDAWSAAAANTSVAYPTAPSGASSADWDFARSMKSIDNTITTVTDPNWNGAATQATRY